MPPVVLSYLVMIPTVLPIVWGTYGLSRWVLSYFSLSISDQIALSFLAALSSLGVALLTAWSIHAKETRN